MKMSELGGRGRGRCRNKPAESRFVTEGTVELNCIVNGVTVKRTVENVQYVPGLIYGLLARKSLNQKGIRIAVEDGGCKITHRNGMILAEVLPTSG